MYIFWCVFIWYSFNLIKTVGICAVSENGISGCLIYLVLTQAVVEIVYPQEDGSNWTSPGVLRPHHRVMMDFAILDRFAPVGDEGELNAPTAFHRCQRPCVHMSQLEAPDGVTSSKRMMCYGREQVCL